MKTMIKRQQEIVQKLVENNTQGEMRLYIWHPKKAQREWLLELEGYHARVHPDTKTIVTLYDISDISNAQTQIVLYFDENEIDDIREHKKLKDLYNKWFFDKQKKGGDINC